MANNHLDNIIINITLDPAPLQRAGFGIPLLIVDGSTSTLGADRVRAYTDVTGAAADVQSVRVVGFPHDAVRQDVRDQAGRAIRVLLKVIVRIRVGVQVPALVDPFESLV